MIALFRIISILIIILFPTLLKAEAIECHYQSSPIYLDGKMTEWGINPRFLNSEAKLLYEVRNDSNQLFLILKTNENATINQMLCAGFQIKFNIKSTPPKICSISSQIKKNNAYSLYNSDKLSHKGENQLIDTILTNGFYFAPKILDSKNRAQESICFATNSYSNEEFIFEIKIPFKELFGNDYSFNIIRKTIIQLRITLNDYYQSSSLLDQPLRSMSINRNSALRTNGMNPLSHNQTMNEMGQYRGNNSGEIDDNNDNSHRNPNRVEHRNFIKKIISKDFVISSIR
jgi:hypothetical protein